MSKIIEQLRTVPDAQASIGVQKICREAANELSFYRRLLLDRYQGLDDLTKWVGDLKTTGCNPASIRDDIHARLLSLRMGSNPAPTTDGDLLIVLKNALTELESDPQCCGNGDPLVCHGYPVEGTCCGMPELGFERAEDIIRAAIIKATA